MRCPCCDSPNCLLVRALSIDNMDRAISHIIYNSRASVKSSRELILERVRRGWYSTTNKILGGHYAPVYHTSIRLCRDTRRYIQTPSLLDAVVSRCLHQILQPDVDGLLPSSVHGWRHGHDVHSMAANIQHRINQGYTWVVSTDIEDAFGSLRHEDIFAGLVKITRCPRFLGVVRSLIVADDTEQPKGIPVGLSLSPLLCNVALASLDNIMNKFGMLRYADDILLMTKDETSANNSLTILKAMLAELQLQLSIPKTRVIDLNISSFAFLGRTFENITHEYLRLSPKTTGDSKPCLLKDNGGILIAGNEEYGQHTGLDYNYSIQG